MTERPTTFRRRCPECGRLELWEMEPDAGGTELICHSCGFVSFAPFRAVPSGGPARPDVPLLALVPLAAALVLGGLAVVWFLLHHRP